MNLRRTALALAFTAALASAPASLSAQNHDPEVVKEDVNAWADAMSTSFAPGKWEGTTTIIEDGVAKPDETSTDCVKPGSLNPMFGELRSAFSMVIDNTDCTTQFGGAGSMSLVLDCRRSDGGHVRFTSQGTHTTTSVDWSIDITSDGPGAFGTSRMQLRARKLSDKC
jgi:hypothetical protein